MPKTVRLISAGVYDTRGPDVFANIGKDRRFINCYRAVYDDPVSGPRAMIVDRPGWLGLGVAISGSSSSYPYGWAMARNIRFGGYGICMGDANVFDTTATIDVLYAGTNLGQITPGGTEIRKCFLTQAQTSANYFHLIAANRGATTATQEGVAYYHTVTSASAAGALTQITGGGWPSNGIGPLTQKWGFVFHMTQDGYAYNSDLNSVSAWTAGSYFPCNAHPDQGRGIWSCSEDLLAAFGTEHIEILYNANVATLSPLKRVQNGVIPIGVATASSIVDTGNGLVFIGMSAKTSAVGVYMLRGMSLTKLSTPTIDAYLQTSFKLRTSPQLAAFQIEGHTCVMFLLSSNTGSTVAALCVRISDGFWFEWGFGASSQVWPIAIAGTADGTTVCVSGGSNTRDLYTLDEITPAWQDAGQAYTVTQQSGRTDLGTSDDKTLNALTLVGDLASSGDVHTVYTSVNDASFASVGTVDMSTQERSIHGLGSFSTLAVRVEHTANGSRLEAVDATLEKWA